MFEHIEKAPADPILGLTDAYRADARSPKVNLGVGVFMNDKGITPVLECVRKAERILWELETSKTYLPIAGTADYAKQVADLVWGGAHPRLRAGQIAVAQSLGGTGALRVGFELVRRFRPEAAVWVPAPTWGNHIALLEAVGLQVKTYPWFNAAAHDIDVEPLCATLESVPASDVVLLHACCHNPTGADPDAATWERMARIAAKAGWMPFFDFAYQGFGENLVDDRAGMLRVLEQVPEALVATSFSKNLGLYAERIGSLHVLAATAESAAAALSHVRRIIRTLYSNPPKHGAALVKTVLEDTELRALWISELSAMQRRIAQNRVSLVEGLAARIPQADFSYIARQKGMFSYSGLTPAQVTFLREEKAIYVVQGGRINIAGLLPDAIDYVCDAIAESLRRAP